VRRLLGRRAEQDPFDDFVEMAAPAEAVGSPAPAPPAPPAEAQAEGEKFALTPERLSAIASLNPQLEKVSAQLEAVPVFTAAVGNGTSPLTVPGEDGQKLAYFFTESVDAEAFLSAVMQHTGSQLEAQVIGVSLSDIIQAYSNPAAVAARETFVLIPTMTEVGSARALLKEQGAPEPKENQLSPGTGLVPIFWSDDLAVQSAAGKQRKVLFFRKADLQSMWKNLTDARQLAGEGEELPTKAVVHVSSLQAMASILQETNKTDDVIFLASSSALRAAQAGGAGGCAPTPLRRSCRLCEAGVERRDTRTCGGLTGTHASLACWWWCAGPVVACAARWQA